MGFRVYDSGCRKYRTARLPPRAVRRVRAGEGVRVHGEDCDLEGVGCGHDEFEVLGGARVG